MVSMWSIRCSSWGGVALVVTLRVKSSPDVEGQKLSWWTLQVAGSQLRNPPVKFRHER